MLTHSPEPWTPYQREDTWWEIDHDRDGSLDCRLSEEDARRICACVNACQNVPTDVLQAVQFLNPVADPTNSDYAKGFMDGAGHAIKKLAKGQS